MSIEARLIRAGAAIVVLVVVLMLVMGFWGNYRSAIRGEDEVETSSTVEPTSTPDGDSTDASESTSGESSARGETGTVVVLIDGLNFRSSPQRDAELIRGLPEGERLTHIATENGWYKVKASDGTEGWVSASEQYTRLEK